MRPGTGGGTVPEGGLSHWCNGGCGDETRWLVGDGRGNAVGPGPAGECLSGRAGAGPDAGRLCHAHARSHLHSPGVGPHPAPHTPAGFAPGRGDSQSAADRDPAAHADHAGGPGDSHAFADAHCFRTIAYAPAFGDAHGWAAPAHAHQRWLSGAGHPVAVRGPAHGCVTYGIPIRSRGSGGGGAGN